MSQPDTAMLVKVETGANSNKFYELTLTGDTVQARWGRVGANGQTKAYSGGRAKFESLLRSKKAKGYREVEVVDSNTHAASHAALRTASLRGLAKPAFADDQRIATLVDSIVSVNAHSIATASGGKIALADGQLRTPLGVIGRASLDEADKLLDIIAASSDHDEQVRHLEHYLTLVPQKVGSRRGWEDALLTPEALGKQSEFVRQLRDSLDFIEAQQAATGNSATVDFRYSLGIVEPDDPRFAQVASAFERSLNHTHPSRRYKLTGLYDMTPPAEALDAYMAQREAKGNEQWMWHGTRASNVLSILAKGLYCPPANASFTTGRMFGNGIYASRQSTKSLNYSGGVWAGQRLSDKAYMFSLQAVMGKSYAPKSWGENWSTVHRNYDSINVEPGTAGVANHEAVIWDTERINLRYLCEFSL